MSYDLSLCKDAQPVAVKRHEEGGTFVQGGTELAELNVTYNYCGHFCAALDSEKGIRWLYGKTGAETTERLEKAVALLGTKRDSDYWNPTAGNAGHALLILLAWARQHPDAVFEGD